MTDSLRHRYCVVCTRIEGPRVRRITRIVGPFESQEATVEWAQAMRQQNHAWSYTPDVMQEPTEVASHA